jgi:hypothetical protein
MTTHEPVDEDDTPAYKRTLRFVYRHSTALVAVSVAWFVASLPLVTVGPATLGAYAAVRSIRQTGRVDRAYVLRALRRNGVHAALLSFLPLLFVATATLYLWGGLALGGVTNVVAVVGFYVGGYLGVALIPTFVVLADGETPVEALKEGYVWVARRPVSTVSLALVTAGLFVATAALTIGFVLLFPALTFSYHVEVLATDPDADASRDASVLSRERAA